MIPNGTPRIMIIHTSGSSHHPNYDKLHDSSLCGLFFKVLKWGKKLEPSLRASGAAPILPWSHSCYNQTWAAPGPSVPPNHKIFKVLQIAHRWEGWQGPAVMEEDYTWVDIMLCHIFTVSCPKSQAASVHLVVPQTLKRQVLDSSIAYWAVIWVLPEWCLPCVPDFSG